jgi:DNA-binding LacI/PurR family transcriptional regulator
MWGIQDQFDLDAYQAVLHLRDTDLTREIDCMRLAQHTGSDGMLVVTPRIRGNELSDLMRDSIPCVFTDYYADSATVPCVRATNRQGARDATEYLVSLGHRRIGFVAGVRDLNITESCEHGYRSTLIEADIPFVLELIVEGDFGQPSGYRAGTQLLALDERPTAIFGCSDLMARGVIAAAYVVGLRVPQDLSVVGHPISAPDNGAAAVVRDGTYGCPDGGRPGEGARTGVAPDRVADTTDRARVL